MVKGAAKKYRQKSKTRAANRGVEIFMIRGSHFLALF